jgi:Major Facilitator Superfamily
MDELVRKKIINTADVARILAATDSTLTRWGDTNGEVIDARVRRTLRRLPLSATNALSCRGESDYPLARYRAFLEHAKKFSSHDQPLAKTAISRSLRPAFFFFQFADASLLPLVGQNLAEGETDHASLLMAGLIVVPQVVVALLSPWVGYYSDKWGRKPLLLLGFGLEIIRVLLFAFSANVSVLVTAQLLGGISAAAVTVLTILVITDLTTGTGRFNLVRGAIGTLIAIAASISTTATGFLFEALGNWEGFLILAATSAIATASLWAAMPETRPAKYLD